MLNVLLFNAVLQFLWQPVAVRIAERVGTARFMTATLLAQALLVFPMFLLVNTGNVLAIALGLGLSIVTGSGYYAVLAGFLAQAFPVSVRYTGVSFAYQTSSTLIGGTTPLLAQSFLNSSGWPGVAGFNIVLVALTIAGVLGLAALSGFSAAHEQTLRQQ